ncbi:hypothetical protein HBA55_35210 [Pseudomaricurvus alkylphenolicus]|uniref:hypothetical protein n=1 Tax=Pseudomaricurvus alkylphenolicus TaxID=1306991 RepID=UPI00141FDF0F|nr:hypothetical protein [Pseudomaricurvus alkylphenolicus]NIB44881.1 hypothetical protein [Pseudomaricurvus alkylphenolicus]
MALPFDSAVALSLLSRLIPSVTNTGKLIAANTLIRAVYRLLSGRKVRVLVDSWYMRHQFIQAMLDHGFNVIGQVRIDTRLYDRPPANHQIGEITVKQSKIGCKPLKFEQLNERTESKGLELPRLTASVRSKL